MENKWHKKERRGKNRNYATEMGQTSDQKMERQKRGLKDGSTIK